jgi:hypothetical protein
VAGVPDGGQDRRRHQGESEPDGRFDDRPEQDGQQEQGKLEGVDVREGD